MNENEIKGQWKVIKGEIRKKWGALSDDDLDQVKGDVQKLEGLMQKKLGMQQDEAKREAKKFLDDYERSHPQSGGGGGQNRPGGSGGSGGGGDRQQ